MRVLTAACIYNMPKRKSDTIAADDTLNSESKKPKKCQDDQLKKFITFAEKEDTLIAGLSYFLTTVESDGGEAFVDIYLHKYPECSHLMQPLSWDKQRRSRDVLLICFSCLEQVLLYTASLESDPVLASVGLHLTQNILSSHMRTVYSSLVTAAPARLIGACVGLLAAMVTQGPMAAREVLLGFNFGYKPLGLLLSKTDKIKERQDSVRISLIKFALCFLMVGTGDTISTFLETKGFLSSVFGLLAKDNTDIVYLVLSAVKQKVVINPAISKKTKSRFFNHGVLKGLSQLLSRDDDLVITADDESSETSKPVSTTIKELTFSFMHQLLTDFRHGIPYRTKETPPAGLLRTNNPGLLQATLILSGCLENPLARKLVLASISTCPDILLPFLKQASISLELKPVSKWLIGIQFLNEMFGQLPAVCELMGADVASLVPHLDVAVSITLPSITSRAMLSQWIQSPVLHVKHGVLQLLGSVLNRASAMIAATSSTGKANEQRNFRRWNDAVFCQKYSDTLLKNLPDIKTIIGLRQQLVSKKPLGTSDAIDGEQTPEQVAKTEELSKTNTLLSLTTVVMCGYQSLCPSLYAQVDFGLHRLLPPLNASHQLDEDSPMMAHEVLLPSLQLLLDAPQDGMKRLDSTVIKTLMLLIVQKEDVSTLAADLLIKVLSTVDSLNGLELELKLILKAMVDQKGFLVLPEAVNFVVDVLLTFAQDSFACAENVQDILAGGGRSLREENERQLLEKILAAPLDAGFDGCGDMNLPKCEGSVLPLIYCLLTKFTASELGTLALFVSEIVMQLLLIQDDYQAFVSLVLHCLCSEEFTRKCDGSTWKNLIASLVGHLMDLCPEFHLQMKDRSSFVEAKQLSDKRLQKRLDDQDVLPLLSQATGLQLVSLFRSATKRDSNLLTFAERLCAVRPLRGLLGPPVDGNDFMELLLPHLSFAVIITQSLCGAAAVEDREHINTSQRIVRMLSTPIIAHHLCKKIKEGSADRRLHLYNTRVTLSLFNTLDSLLSGAGCPSVRSAMDSCISLLAEILQCTPASEQKLSRCVSVDQIFLDVLSKKLTQDAVQVINNWTGKDVDKERGRTVVSLLGALKRYIGGSCAQEILKMLMKSLREPQHPLPAVVVDMLEVLLCTEGGDLALGADVLRDMLNAATRIKSPRLDAIVLALLDDGYRHKVVYSSEEVLCAQHMAGANPVARGGAGAPSDHCARAAVCAMLRAVLPALEAKNVMRSEELLSSLRMEAAPPSVSVTVSMQREMLGYCLEALDCTRTKIAVLLIQRSSAARGMFKEGWSERLCQAMRGSEGDGLYYQLIVMKAYLDSASRAHDLSSDVPCKVVRKGLWKMCSGLLADRQCSQEIALCSQGILQLLSLPALQGDHDRFMKRVKRLAGDLEWKSGGNVAFMTSVASHLPAATCKAVFPAGVWNDFAADIVRNHLDCSGLVHLLAILVRKVYIDGDCANYLPLKEVHEMIWSHPSFTKVMLATYDTNEAILKAKGGLIELLVAVVEASPSLCASIHVETLLGAYHATTGRADRGLLYLLYLCEVNGVSLEQYRPFLWGGCALEHFKARQDLGLLLWKQPGPQEVLDQVERELMQASSRHFPLEAGLEPSDPYAETKPQQEIADEPQETLYDPSFFLPMLSHLLDSSNYLDCRKFVEIGCLGYLFASLCSKNVNVRTAGGHALSRFSTHLDGASFREKIQIVMVFDVVKNSLEENNERLPSFFSSFLPTVAHILMHPDHHLYRTIAYHLASKPTIDMSDMPLYRTLLHSSSDQHHQERVWMMRILVDGLRCAEDYAIYRRRRVLSHIMSLYHVSTTTKEVRGLILQLMNKACIIPLIAIDLVWNLGVLPWLQQVSLSGEKAACVNVLQSLWKCLKVDTALQPSQLAEELDSNEKQLKRPPLLEEELALTLVSTQSNSI